MKTQIKTTIFGTTLTLAFALAVWMPASTQAADQEKGAQHLVQPILTSDTAAPGAMKCAQCKSVVVQNTAIEKGHVAVVTYAEKHVCPGCDNVSEITGAGKARKDVLIHVCSLTPGGAAACCK